ncbi:MerR family transcriptional regulator [Sediminibacillus halophilus]|uniref:DNA-binding transcriptional regulator, MerR family n=1 Tax=Sediminibacillus halophilus TaxID=482461 RepID=A0A1G9NR18_9BACI|nr:MerR family transcriptional regulator [Sediminibacillus halophilus]SDL88753.1 DNA-binding transcriptional regulator, MerR family [Sediminibacillus halophilus]
MNFSINEVAKKFGISSHTLRFYDKEGLMPFIGRDKSGNRVFTEEDLNWVAMVCCLKDTGMSIKEIKQYADWCAQGMQTLDERKEMLAEHRQQVLKQIEDLKKNLDLIDYKIEVYENPEWAQKLYGSLEKQQ